MTTASSVRASVTVPEPIGFCADPAVLGGPFAVVTKVSGIGLGPKPGRSDEDRDLGRDRLGKARLKRRGHGKIDQQLAIVLVDDEPRILGNGKRQRLPHLALGRGQRNAQR